MSVHLNDKKILEKENVISNKILNTKTKPRFQKCKEKRDEAKRKRIKKLHCKYLT